MATFGKFSTPRAQRVIIVTGVITGVCVIGKNMLPEEYGGTGELPSARLLISGGVMYLVIASAAEFAPSFAGMLAIAVMVTAVRLYGIDLLTTNFTHK